MTDDQNWQQMGSTLTPYKECMLFPITLYSVVVKSVKSLTYIRDRFMPFNTDWYNQVIENIFFQTTPYYEKSYFLVGSLAFKKMYSRIVKMSIF